jgi:hypothetical protein
MARFPYDVFRERLLWLIDPSKDKSAQAIIQKTKGGSWREIKKLVDQFTRRLASLLKIFDGLIILVVPDARG